MAAGDFSLDAAGAAPHVYMPGCFPDSSTVSAPLGEGSIKGSLVEIPVNAALESSICKRGRRRLRELQANSTAKIRYDRPRRVLKVFGSEDEIDDVRRQLECLGGMRKFVSTAVWCELMRTRLAEGPEQSSLLQLQLLSGCRIHIERSLQEVRLFGAAESTCLGEQLLDKFELQCIARPVPIRAEVTLPEDVVEEISESCGVTINLEAERVVIFGRLAAVADAEKRLQKEIACAETRFEEVNDVEEGVSDGQSPVTTPCAANGYDSQLSFGTLPPQREQVAHGTSQVGPMLHLPLQPAAAPSAMTPTSAMMNPQVMSVQTVGHDPMMSQGSSPAFAYPVMMPGTMFSTSTPVLSR